MMNAQPSGTIVKEFNVQYRQQPVGECCTLNSFHMIIITNAFRNASGFFETGHIDTRDYSSIAQINSEVVFKKQSGGFLAIPFANCSLAEKFFSAIQEHFDHEVIEITLSLNEDLSVKPDIEVSVSDNFILLPR